MKKIIFVFFGIIFLCLGSIGVVIPVLPTTPFILLSLYFFARSSKKIESWLLSTKLYKKYCKSFVENKSMTLKNKLTILIPVSAMLLIAMYFSKPLYARILIGSLIVIKYVYFIFGIDTIPANKKSYEER